MIEKFGKMFGVTTVAALALAFPSQAFAQNLLDWQALGGTGAIQSFNSKFTLKNVSDKESIKYGKRTWGINLVWDKSTSLNNVQFDKETGNGDVKYGEHVAIRFNNGGAYLRYKRVRFGINLDWSQTPVYEWVIGGGQPGQSVKFGESFALMNEVE